MTEAEPPRELSTDELVLLLRVILPVVGDAFAGDLSPHILRKLTRLFIEVPLTLPDAFEWGSPPPDDPQKRLVSIGLERVVHRLRYAAGDDTESFLAQPLC